MFTSILLSIVTLASVAIFVSAYTRDALADQIRYLPGAEKLNVTFNQFSGYLNIPGIAGDNSKFLHYWYKLIMLS